MILEALYRAPIPDGTVRRSWDEFEEEHRATGTLFLLHFDSESAQSLLRLCRDDGLGEPDSSVSSVLADFATWCSTERHELILIAPRCVLVSRHILTVAQSEFRSWQFCSTSPHSVEEDVHDAEMPDAVRRLLLLQSPELTRTIRGYFSSATKRTLTSYEELASQLMKDGYWEPAYRLELLDDVQTARPLIERAADTISHNPDATMDVVGYVDSIADVPSGLDGIWVITGGPGSGKSTALRSIADGWALPREGSADTWLPMFIAASARDCGLRESLRLNRPSRKQLDVSAHQLLADAQSDSEVGWLTISPIMCPASTTSLD